MEALRASDPRRIGPYEVLGRLGAGGMGEVYLAEVRGGPRLAVKVVRSEHAQDRTFRARFRQEVRAAQTIGGAGTYTARVMDADTEAERPWMATEFVDGPNLRDAVLDHGALPERAVLLLAGAFGEALAAIHAKGMVHRDLKPSNILLAADGPRVIDFGIVRALEATALTNTGAVVGSVGYVSPEQIRNGAQVGPPSDVFSLGAVLAYAAAGREPFGEGQDSVILLRILTRDFDLSGVPEGLRGLVESCLRDDPADRPTPAEVVEAAGHTARSLRKAMGPGWIRAEPEAAPEPGDDARWVPEPESGERPSRVEYVAPVTVPDAPAPVTDHLVTMTGPAAPARSSSSRRALLRALAGGAALAAVGGGVGGWLWLREPDPGKGGAASGASGGRGSASPSGSAGKAVRASILWRAATGKPSDTLGPCAALAPDGGTVYVAGADGSLRALATDGTQRWRLTLSNAEYGSVSSPAVSSDGTVFVAVGPQQENGGSGRLVAVGAAGRSRWTKDLPGNYGYEGPVTAGDLVLAGYGDPLGSTGGLRAYDTTGRTVWTQPMGGGPDVAALVVGKVVYVGGYDNYLHAFALADGHELWRTRLDSDVARPAVAGNTIAVGSNDQNGYYLYGLGTDGRRTWKKEGRGGGYTSYTTAVGSVFLAVNGTRLMATGSDGTALWTYRGNAPVTDPVTRDGTVYLRCGTELHALDTKGALRWKLEVGDGGDAQSSPVLAGDRLYMAASDGLIAVRLST
ncbi:PQQ-binding-like beta-propeller repeat protein [Streptomyces sp. NPDC059467]|uniref:protein kinase domain-containing protein n=1 Tax=Streptomyces sp. NPDC059467 TaxID=3346844 RepID=UPI0036CFDCAE